MFSVIRISKLYLLGVCTSSLSQHNLHDLGGF